MLDFKTIADAVWANDALADEGHELNEILAMLGLDVQDVMRIADQRALRAVLTQRGDVAVARMKRDAYERYSRDVLLNERERATQMFLMAVWMDAFAAGVRAGKGDS